MRRKRIAIWVMIVAMAFAWMPMRASAETLPPAASQISNANALLGVAGTYENAPADQLITRINEIRREAYNDGLVDHYVPIKWSEALEYMAQIRSVEASVYEDHVRPKGGYIFGLEVDGVSSYSENLAWGRKALGSVELWYSEKKDLVNHTGGETGHYESLIDPEFTHIGIGSFKAGDNWNCVCAEFTEAEGISEGRTGISGNHVQLIEIPKSDIRLSLSGSDMAVGQSKQFVAKAVYNGCDMVLPEVKWTSSDESVATVLDGSVTGVSVGSTSITAELTYYGIDSGLTASKAITVTANPIPAVPTGVKLVAGKKCFTVKWKKSTHATSYKIQYSLKKSMKSAKTVKVGNVASKKIKKLKAKKYYYVRVKAVNSDGSSTWSKVKKVRTK